MSKLASLHKHLCEKLSGHVHSKKIHATQAGGTIQTGRAEYLGDGGFIAAGWKYNAGILIENYPHHKLNPLILFALISTWLSQNDDDRELPDPAIEIDVNNEESADVLILLEFEEPIEMIPDDNGLVSVGGDNYSVGTPQVVAAETFELNTEVELEHQY